MASSPLASRSVRSHYARGVVGLMAAVATVAGAKLGVAAAPALLIVVVAAWRGCPTCWAVGLVQTKAGGAGVAGPCSISTSGARPPGHRATRGASRSALRRAAPMS